ncbi:hypothetical protein ACVWW4_000302 [Bradyrhizobium sp. LB7.1]
MKPRGRRLRNPRSGRCRHVTLGQPDSAAEPARRHIDQHQVNRPATEPVLLRRRFPARDRDLAAIHAPDPRALDLDLAAVETNPSPRSAPMVRPPRHIATVARPAGRRHIRLHHRAERLDPCRKAEPIEARSHFRKRFVHSPGRRPTSRCDISRHGVALLCGISTPSLPAQGGQRRPLQKFKRTRGIPLEIELCQWIRWGDEIGPLAAIADTMTIKFSVNWLMSCGPLAITYLLVCRSQSLC